MGVRVEERPGISRRKALIMGALAALPLVSACSGSGSEGRTPRVTGVPETPPAPIPTEETPVFQSGMTLTSWTTGELGSPQGIQALQGIADTGANALALVPTGYQDNPHATDIFQHPEKTSSDEELRDTIRRAQEVHGLTVMLKPHVDNLDDQWRGYTGDGFDADARRKWFTSYTGFIVPYAAMAQENGIKLFSVGTELKSLSGADEEWINVVEAVRGVYGGEVVYSAQHDEEYNWSSALDAIGIDEYSPITDELRPRPETLAEWWTNRTNGYIAASERFQKPIILTEIGCSSSVGALRAPSQAGTVPDEDIQAAGYKAALDALSRPEVQRAVKGAYWWNWYTYEFPDPAADTGLSPQGKKAQTVFEEFNRRR